MQLLKKTFLLLLTAAVLCGSFPNTAQASNVSDGLPEAAPSDLIVPEEDQDHTNAPESESEDLAEASSDIPDSSDTCEETAPAETEQPSLVSDEEVQSADLPENKTDEGSDPEDGGSIYENETKQGDIFPDEPEITEEISEDLQKDALLSAADPEAEISIIEPYIEVYVNPLYEDILQPSDLTWPEDTAVAAYSNEEYLSTPKAAGDQLRASMVQRQETIGIYYQVPTGQDVPYQDIMEQAFVHTKNPVQGDYLRWNTGGYTVQIKGYRENGIDYLTLYYTPTYYTTAAQEAELTAEIQQVLNQLYLGSKNDYEKICAIYDYICQNVTYDYDNLNDSAYMLKHTAYAALKHHTAVCQGYALLFYRLALEAGIDNRIISGTSSNENHGWNIVYLDKVYYNIDSTWDAPRKQAGMDYRCFLKCDENFSDHTRASQYADSLFYSSYPMGTSDYSLQKTDLSSGTISLSDNSYVYDGTEKKPLVTVRYGGKTLVPNSDYQILYQNNRDIGKASVTVTGVGIYKGTLTAFFDITRPADPTPTDPQPVVQGWKQINGNWYYYINGNIQTGWQKVGQKWYYMDDHGIMKTGWLRLGNTWYYLNSNGDMATGWLKLGNTWYYLNPSGSMATGWLKLGNIWYYLNPNGGMATGWLRLGNTWYYLNPSGSMATGWLKLGNIWYYLNPSGSMATGWLKLSNIWYYLNPNGDMATGWLRLGNTWYYLNPNGSMATSDTSINGVVNRFNNSGVWLGTK